MAKPRRRLKLIITFLAWAIPISLLSQNRDSLLNISFRLLSIGKANWNNICYIKNNVAATDSTAELQELLFNYLDRSVDFYDYKGSNPLIFYRIENKHATGKVILKPIASVYITPNITKPLLFFSNAGIHFKNVSLTNTDISNPEFDIIATADSATAFPKGHVMFLNTLGFPLYSKFGDDKTTFQPGITKPISVAKHFNKEIFVGMILKRDGLTKVVLKNRWRFLPDYRYIILIKPPKRKDSWRIRVLQIAEYVKENKAFNPDYKDPESTEDDI